MLENLAAHLEAQHAPLKGALVALVRIPSVCEEGGPDGYPFGEAIDRALRKTLEIAGDLGFRTRYGEGGYYGWAEIGEGPGLLGILAHLDVVPAGRLTDWEHDPFGAEPGGPVEQDGVLYGRGTQDDKGGLLAALFAVKALMDAGVQFNKRVRFIFGTDEESLWRCIKRYKEREELPDLGFSPDARFPLIYAEKGLLQFQLLARLDAQDSGTRAWASSLHGGSAFNAVPDSIVYAGSLDADLARSLDALGFAYTRGPNGIEVRGKAAHAMAAETGVNAIARLCIALDRIGVDSPTVRFVAHEVGEDAHAAGIFGDCADEPSGKLRFNVGKIDVDTAGGVVTETLSLDCRIPVTITKDQVVAQIAAAAARYGLAYREFDWLAPLYLPLDHPVVQTLLRVYREVSGDTVSEPISSGGATYARAMPNCVAFGALLHDELLTEHQPNERVPLANLHKAMQIYARAVFELTR